MPDNVSLEGHRVDAILDVSLLLIGVCAAVGTAVLLAVLVLGGKLRSPKRNRLVPLVVAGVFLFVVDGYLLFRSLSDVGALTRTGGEVRIEINAQQWAWAVRHPGIDGRFTTADDIVSTNELVVPVGTRVDVQLASSDVVHAFHVPALRIKRDAVPGRLARFGFTVTETGELEIACAQFCGTAHYRMRGRVRVLEKSAFTDWVQRGSADGVRRKKERARAAEAGEVQTESVFPQRKGTAGRDWGWPWR